MHIDFLAFYIGRNVTNVVNLMPINLFTDYAIWTLSQFRMTSGAGFWHGVAWCIYVGSTLAASRLILMIDTSYRWEITGAVEPIGSAAAAAAAADWYKWPVCVFTSRQSVDQLRNDWLPHAGQSERLRLLSHAHAKSSLYTVLKNEEDTKLVSVTRVKS